MHVFIIHPSTQQNFEHHSHRPSLLSLNGGDGWWPRHSRIMSYKDRTGMILD